MHLKPCKKLMSQGGRGAFIRIGGNITWKCHKGRKEKVVEFSLFALIILTPSLTTFSMTKYNMNSAISFTLPEMGLSILSPGNMKWRYRDKYGNNDDVTMCALSKEKQKK